MVPRLGAPSRVALPRNATAYQEAAVRRAVDVINRALLPEHRLRVERTSNSFTQTQLTGTGGTPTSTAWRRTATGRIHVQFGFAAPGSAPGWAYTDGTKGLISIDTNGSSYEHPERLVATLVHELLHAVGFMSHPHDVHTSILSYRFDRDGIVDELPLVDQAMVWDMYEWGDWSGVMYETFDVIGGVQYGARFIHLEDGGSIVGPFVDGGRLRPPASRALSGTASWTGSLTGFDSEGEAFGRVQLTANFATAAGTATFDPFQTWNSTAWTRSTLHGRGYRYTLDYDRHWFRSTDTDPDVVGAIYGVAAGTIERHGANWLIAGFGAERD